MHSCTDFEEVNQDSVALAEAPVVQARGFPMDLPTLACKGTVFYFLVKLQNLNGEMLHVISFFTENPYNPKFQIEI